MLLQTNLYRKLRHFNPKRILTALALLLSVFSFGQSDFVESIYFKSNSYKPDKRYFQVLDEIGRKCSSDTFGFLKIFAYADTKGLARNNKLLSQKRAEGVYNYLAKNFQFDTTKIYVTWLGEETDEAYDLHFPHAHVQQRYVDIILIFKKQPD